MQMRYGLSSDMNKRADTWLVLHRLPFGFAEERFYFWYFQYITKNMNDFLQGLKKNDTINQTKLRIAVTIDPVRQLTIQVAFALKVVGIKELPQGIIAIMGFLIRKASSTSYCIHS